MENDEVKFTYSGVLMKDGKKTVCVRFERGESDCAEGRIPQCRIEKQQGFSSTEIEQMETYLVNEQMNIINKAKELNNIMKWL